MVWHTCEGVSSIDQWIWDKGIKRFLFYLMLLRLVFRLKIHRPFLSVFYNVIQDRQHLNSMAEYLKNRLN